MSRTVLLYLKCFLTSFCAPLTEPSLICLAWVHVPVHCSTAYLVQLITPGAACHASFRIDQFQFIFLNAHGSEVCPVSFFLTSLRFICCCFCFLLFSWKTQKRLFLKTPSVLIGIRRELNFLYLQGNAMPKHFSIGQPC